MQVLQKVLPSQEEIRRSNKTVTISRRGYVVVRCECGCVIKINNGADMVCPNCGRVHGLLQWQR